jgi:hypothetical protein
MDAYLKIIRSKSGTGDDAYAIYDFNFWGDNVPAVTYQYLVEPEKDKSIRGGVSDLRKYIESFRQDVRTKDEFTKKVKEWLEEISRSIRHIILPPKGTPFANAMVELENKARSGEDIFLTILTNDYLIPFWLTKCYTRSGDELNTWDLLFSFGFVPAHINEAVTNKENQEPHVVRGERIALLARPSPDLSAIQEISASFNNKNEPKGKDVLSGYDIDIIDGARNSNRESVNRFGLFADEIVEALEEHQVIFYYGHFDFNEKSPEDSCMVALNYAYGNEEKKKANENVRLSSIKETIKGKVLFLNSCRSIGLPIFDETDFPRHDRTLPNFFLSNNVVCIGTLYPIFHDAAAVYMRHFIEFLVKGECVGKAVKEARVILNKQKRYDHFDWAPYVLVGKPQVRIEISKVDDNANGN